MAPAPEYALDAICFLEYIQVVRRVEYPTFADWMQRLSREVFVAVEADIRYLLEFGRSAVLPSARLRIQQSGHFPDMAETRTDVEDHAGRQWVIRTLAVFAASDSLLVFCVGGDSMGRRAADRRLVRHLGTDRRPGLRHYEAEGRVEVNEPKDWLDDNRDVIYRDPDDKATWRGDPTADEEIAEIVKRRRLEHETVASLQQLRKLLGRTQVDVANQWGRPQSQVSRLETDPLHAELASVLAYIQALGGRLTVEAEIEGRIYTVDLAETA